MESEIIEGEVVEDLLPAVVEPASPTLFRTDDPAEIVQRATAVADQLSHVLTDRNLTTSISGREHVRVEGWTLLGTMLGVFPVVEWTRAIIRDNKTVGWEARVEARTLAGAVVGAAEAECTRDEKTWAKRDDYALRSMAQTRATSKALRGPLGFVVSLAGFDPTPEEEMPSTAAGAATTSSAAVDEAAPNLPASFPAGDDLGERIGGALRHVDPSVDWRSTWENANRALYGDVRQNLPPREKAESLYLMAWVADALTGGPDFPPPTDDDISGAFASAFGIPPIEVARHEPSE